MMKLKTKERKHTMNMSIGDLNRVIKSVGLEKALTGFSIPGKCEASKAKGTAKTAKIKTFCKPAQKYP